MPDLARLFIRHFWLLAIVVSFINAAIVYLRLRKVIESQPELRAGYRNLLLGQVTILNVPWLVMGAGTVIGGVPTLFHFFNPRDGNPWVIAFHVALVLLFVASAVWIYSKGGAEYLLRHPGLSNFRATSATQIKLFFGLCLAGGIAAVIMMWTGLFTVPDR